MPARIKQFVAKLENFILYLLIFLFPTQLALHFWPTEAFVFGIRVDFLAPAIYLSDLLVAMLLISWLVFNWSKAVAQIRERRTQVEVLILIAVLNISE